MTKTDWSRQRMVAACLTLLMLVAVIYLQTGWHSFINFDDNFYVYKNRVVADGFSLAAIKWAFSSFYQANWHPLTWLSHLLDVTLFGLNPAGHHLHNVLLHGVNALLLFLFLARVTGAPGKSLLVAALFAVHPLRVESVAWVAERKDVLGALFGLASLLCYGTFARRGSRAQYLLSLLLFAASLMSKPVLVTLPVILLVLDWWPLQRWQPTPGVIRSLLKEKIPYLALAMASAVITLVAQFRGGAIVDMQAVPLTLRLGNAALSYWRYVAKTLYPADLSFYYPLPRTLDILPVALSVAILALLTLLILRHARQLPAVACGWFWYLTVLLPMIGIIQVGGQAMADRYAYLPTIGLIIAMVWGGEQLSTTLNLKPVIPMLAGTIVVVLLATIAWKQTTLWRNGYALYSHAYQLQPENYMVLTKIGDLLVEDDRVREAIPYYNRSLKLDPSQRDVYNNLAMCLKRTGNLQQAHQLLLRAIDIDPGYPEALYNLGNVLNLLGQPAAAITSFTRVLQLQPDDAGAHYNLAKTYLALQRYPEAIAHFEAALALVPNLADAPLLLGEARRAAAAR